MKKIKVPISLCLIVFMLMSCFTAYSAEVEWAPIEEVTFDSLSVGASVVTVDGVNYVVEKDSVKENNLVGKITPFSAKASPIHSINFDVLKDIFTIETDVKFDENSSDITINIDLISAKTRKTYFQIKSSGVYGNNEKPSNDKSDLLISNTSLSDSKWHKVIIKVNPSTEKYEVLIDGSVKTPTGGYYLRGSLNDNISGQGISSVLISALGYNSKKGSVYLDNIAVKTQKAVSQNQQQTGTQELVGNDLLKEKLKGSISFYNGSSCVLVNDALGYIEVADSTIFPQYVNNEFYVPARFLTEKLGGKYSIDNGKLLMEVSGKKIEATAGNKDYSLNNESKSFINEPVLINDVAFIALKEYASIIGKFIFEDSTGLFVISDKASILSKEADSAAILLMIDKLRTSNLPDAAKEKAVVFKTNKTAVYPDETVMLYGGNFDKTCEISFRRVADEANPALFTSNFTYEDEFTIKPLQINENCIKFVVPSEVKMGIFSVKVKNAAGISDEVLINKPDPWWFMGDAFNNATAGGEIKVIGSNLSFDDKAKCMLYNQNDKSEFILETKEQGKYSAVFGIPTNITPGTYEIYVYNGYGNGAAWTYLDYLDIDRKEIQAEKIINLAKDYNINPDAASDCTSALKSALSSLSGAGGVLYLPRGRYKVTEQLNIPEGVTLRGEGKDLTSLSWPNSTVVPASLIQGTNNFTVENLSLYKEGKHGNGITGVNDFKVINCRVRLNAYYTKIDPNFTNPVSANGTGAIYAKNGSNIVIENNDLLHSFRGIGLTGCKYVKITNNYIRHGYSSLMFYGCTRIDVEGNTISALQLNASGMGIGTSGYGSSYFVYMHNNIHTEMYGNDREGVTSDDHGTAYYGGVEKVSGTDVYLKDSSYWNRGHKDSPQSWDIAISRKDNDREWHGVTLFINAGRGAGQYRNIVGGDGAKHIVIDKPWDIDPDETSVLVISVYNGRHIFDNLEFTDNGTGVQLYLLNFDCIVANTKLIRTSSTNAGSAVGQPSWGDYRMDLSWFSEFVDNQIIEGNSWGASNASIGIVASNSMNSMRSSLGHIVKRNTLMNNARIVVQGATNNTIVEKNSVSNNSQGIYLRSSYGNLPTNYLLRANKFENCTANISSGS